MKDFDSSIDMWKELPFDRSEFACKCGCGFDAVDAELLRVLIDLRNTFGPVIISGPNRCILQNEEVQKHYVKNYIPFSSKSYHTKGMAADAKFPRESVKLVYNYLANKYPKKYGFILYSNRIHIDVRSKPYRAKA